MLPAIRGAWLVSAVLGLKFRVVRFRVPVQADQRARPVTERIWRSGTEVLLATGLVYYLKNGVSVPPISNPNRWHTNLFLRHRGMDSWA